jgi:hypothetical protein
MRCNPTAIDRFGPASILAVVLLSVFGDARPTFAQDARPPGEYRQWVPGLLSRSIFKSPVDDKVTVEIFDLMVGPGQSSEAITLTGGAVLDIQAGDASLSVDGKAQRVQAGGVVSLAQNQKIAIDNTRAQRSFVARLILLSRPGG